jgi:surfactin synthase thioesterase subunit
VTTRHAETAASSPWVRRFHPRPGAAVRLVCLPHAGGSASFFHRLSGDLPPDIEALAIQYPGRQDRFVEPPLRSIAELADGAYEALVPWADRPLAFLGHSMGSSVAYEVVRRFERRKGLVATAFFASGHGAPTVNRSESVHLRDDAGVIAEVRGLGGPGAEAFDEPDLVSLLLPAVRADYRAIETYMAEPTPVPAPADRLRCPLVALVGDADPKVTPDEAGAWGEMTRGPFSLHVFPGDHFYLTPEHDRVVSTVAGSLLDLLHPDGVDDTAAPDLV